jgi:hypothetical protein
MNQNMSVDGRFFKMALKEVQKEVREGRSLLVFHQSNQF